MALESGFLFGEDHLKLDPGLPPMLLSSRGVDGNGDGSRADSSDDSSDDMLGLE